MRWNILSSLCKLFSDTTITTNRNFLRRIPFQKSICLLPPPRFSDFFHPYDETNKVWKNISSRWEFVNKQKEKRKKNLLLEWNSQITFFFYLFWKNISSLIRWKFLLLFCENKLTIVEILPPIFFYIQN